MPTAEIDSINEMLQSVRAALALETPSHKVSLDILGMLSIIQGASEITYPTYWEGIARAYALEGDYFMTRNLSSAHQAYNKAIEFLVHYPFSADTIGDQKRLLEEALWRNFEIALKLGRHEDALVAAQLGLEGIDYAIDDIDPVTHKVYWERGPVVRVRGPLKRLRMRICIMFSLRSPVRPHPDDQHLRR